MQYICLVCRLLIPLIHFCTLLHWRYWHLVEQTTGPYFSVLFTLSLNLQLTILCSSALIWSGIHCFWILVDMHSENAFQCPLVTFSMFLLQRYWIEATTSTERFTVASGDYFFNGTIPLFRHALVMRIPRTTQTNQVHLTGIENIHLPDVNYCRSRNWIPLIGVIDATHRRTSD